MPADQITTYARFYTHSQKRGDPNPIENSKPLYQDVIFAEIMIKGDKNTSFGRPKCDQDETDYPKAWEAFTHNNEDYSEGTILTVLPGVGLSDRRNMESQGIMCVEDLASLVDNVVIGNPGMVNLRKQAKAYLDVLEPERVDAEKKAQHDEMQALKDELASMKLLMTKNTSKPRGRPKKVANLES